MDNHKELIVNFINSNPLNWDNKHQRIEEIQALIEGDGRVFISHDNQKIRVLFNDNCKGSINVLSGVIKWEEQDTMADIVNNDVPNDTQIPTETPPI
jgi:hemin uptake protein HemP